MISEVFLGSKQQHENEFKTLGMFQKVWESVRWYEQEWKSMRKY